jgi:hypothetical protein
MEIIGGHWSNYYPAAFIPEIICAVGLLHGSVSDGIVCVSGPPFFVRFLAFDYSG